MTGTAFVVGSKVCVNVGSLLGALATVDRTERRTRGAGGIVYWVRIGSYWPDPSFTGRTLAYLPGELRATEDCEA